MTTKRKTYRKAKRTRKQSIPEPYDEVAQKLLEIPWQSIFEIKSIIPASRIHRILSERYKISDTHRGLVITHAIKFNVIRPLKKNLYYEYCGPKKPGK